MTPPVEAEQFNLAEILSAHAQLGDDVEAKFAEHEDSISDKTKLKTIKASASAARIKLKKDAIKNKWTAAKFEIEAMRCENGIELELVRAERPVGPAIHARSSAPVTTDILAAACALAGGIEKPEDEFGEQVVEAAQKRFKRGIGIQELLI